jgi:hypothetical protein
MHQKGVLGDGEGGDEEKKESSIRRRFMIMKSNLIAILITGVVLSVVSSCATVPKKPLASGDVRLLSIGVY